MTKYVDADRLREEIKSIEEDARKVRVAKESTMNQKIGADGQVNICQKLNLLIGSLQQEQPEPPIEIAKYYYLKGVNKGLSQGRTDAVKILDEFMKRKADPVIVIKQQKQPDVDLEQEIEKYCRIYYNCNYPDQIQNGRCSPVMPHIVEAARHFAQWGAEHLKK